MSSEYNLMNLEKRLKSVMDGLDKSHELANWCFDGSFYFLEGDGKNINNKMTNFLVDIFSRISSEWECLVSSYMKKKNIQRMSVHETGDIFFEKKVLKSWFDEIKEFNKKTIYKESQ